jgi:hypothetical protein
MEAGRQADRQARTAVGLCLWCRLQLLVAMELSQGYEPYLLGSRATTRFM